MEAECDRVEMRYRRVLEDVRKLGLDFQRAVERLDEAEERVRRIEQEEAEQAEERRRDARRHRRRS